MIWVKVWNFTLAKIGDRRLFLFDVGRSSFKPGHNTISK